MMNGFFCHSLHVFNTVFLFFLKALFLFFYPESSIKYLVPTDNEKKCPSSSLFWEGMI